MVHRVGHDRSDLPSTRWWVSYRKSACQCRGWGFHPGSERIPCASEHLGLGAKTMAPGSHNYSSPRALSPCSLTRGAAITGGLRTSVQSGLYSMQLEKILCSNNNLHSQKYINIVFNKNPIFREKRSNYMHSH